MAEELSAVTDSQRHVGSTPGVFRAAGGVGTDTRRVCLCRGVSDVDYSLYPSVELQRDWLTVYLKSFRHGSGCEGLVTDAEVTQLYIQVCKFSLVSVQLCSELPLGRALSSSLVLLFQGLSISTH